MRGKIWLAAGALSSLALLPASAAPGRAPVSSLAAREASGDIVFSERARRGAPLWLVDKPARHAAGVAVPAGVAVLYGGPTGLAAAGGSGASGGNNGHNDGDHNDDGHGDNGQGGGNSGNNGNGDSPADSGVVARELVNNNEFTAGLAGWDSDGAYTASEFGPIRADAGRTTDGVFAVVHNGEWDQRSQGSLNQSIQVPFARNASFSMLYNFVTTEFPTWQGSEYNDHFKMTLSGPSGELELSKAEFLNSGSFSEVHGVPLFGWDYVFEGGDWQVIGGQTGWQTFNYPKLPLKQGIYALRIEVNDVGDDIVDSAILVDRVSLR